VREGGKGVGGRESGTEEVSEVLVLVLVLVAAMRRKWRYL
jgi:hypothetical protein